MSEISTCFPYRSEAAKDECFAYFDALAARVWPVPSEERVVPTSFGPTFVRISGDPTAPPLVLLAGATGTSLMWAPNVQALSRECRVFAVDQIWDFGKSLSSKPVGSMGDFVDWLDELFDGLRLGAGVNLLGMSYGGALAAQYALRRPERLHKLVLLAPGATVLRPPITFWARLFLGAMWRRRGIPWLFAWIFPDLARKDPARLAEIVEQLRLNMRSLVRRKVPMPPVLSDAEWAGMTTSTLFLVGEHEVIYSATAAVRRLKRVAPCVTAEIVPGAGHDLTLLQADLVDQRVLEFLADGQ